MTTLTLRINSNLKNTNCKQHKITDMGKSKGTTHVEAEDRQILVCLPSWQSSLLYRQGSDMGRDKPVTSRLIACTKELDPLDTSNYNISVLGATK